MIVLAPFLLTVTKKAKQESVIPYHRVDIFCGNKKQFKNPYSLNYCKYHFCKSLRTLTLKNLRSYAGVYCISSMK